MHLQFSRSWALLAVMLIALAAAGRVVWQARFDPAVPFFSGQTTAEWVVAARKPDSVAQLAADQQVAFRKTFVLASVPTHATLRVFVYRSGDVLVNGSHTELNVSRDDDWKRVREIDIAPLLRLGENEIVVRAHSDFGPPAVWVLVDGGDLQVASDATWSTLSVRDGVGLARLATAPMTAGVDSPQPSNAILLAGRSSSAWVVAFAIVAWLTYFASRRFGKLPAGYLLAAAAVAIGALTWHNRELAPDLGFDVEGHLDYVRYILATHRLPLASDGWSMFHPPLYYLAGATLVALFDGGVELLRSLNAVAAVVQCAAVLGSLRILFPAEPKRVIAGFVLAAFVPMQLYLSQFVTNELWAAAFSSLAIWLCLHIIARDVRSASSHIVLGALLGLALLTKFSTLIVAAVVVVILSARLVARRERSPWTWMASVGTVALVMVAVSGWHYVRVAWHFGSPLVGNWDAATGVRWWQDPGYRTVWDYLRFGASLTRPIYSAWNGCADGIYSTLWGDGMFSGLGHLEAPPPWRYELMFPSYWLALLPSAGLVVGLGAAVSRVVRKPRAEWLLLIGVMAGTAFALVSLSLRLPFYGTCKAFYGLPAMVPFAALGGLGLDLMATRLGRLGWLLWVLFGTWALCSYATYWAR